ncbi:FAD-dependent monooxygenase (plasmid) [Streptomyces sp. NBC_00111]|uniref:FAD-dependent oxidoreductase n=1 Tax=unclassified Streptomyces TaxID=2593676 RepID=UPI002E31A657|nr:FAD-dependent oxidoreductase [Streptomyces sp. NBC_01460]
MSSSGTRVLIVGGSLVGLSTAVFLAHHKVPVTLVERHPSTSIHPRAVGYYPRTAELLATVGVEEAAKAAAAGFEKHKTRAGVESLSGKVFFAKEELEGGDELADLTPSPLLLLPQDRLEPILRARAEELGADLRFSTELLSFTQDDEGVSAVVRGADGSETTVAADYLVAADGPRSSVRESLGAEREGRGVLSRHVSIAFGADFGAVLGERRYSVVHVENNKVTGILVHDDTLTEGTLIVGYDPAKGEGLDDFTDARCTELVSAAIGSDEVEVTIRSRFPWDMAELVTDDFVHGRVLIAGDAAHQIPPTGGYGANTGIADAFNLSWKLASVLEGTAGRALLDTYQDERRPVGVYTAQQGSLQLAVRSRTATEEQRAATHDAMRVTMGQAYPSGAFVDEEGAERLPLTSDPRDLRGEPGTRAPYVVLERDVAPVTTLDLFGDGFVLLAGAEGGSWAEAAATAASELGLDLTFHHIAPAAGEGALTDVEGRWAEAYGVGAAGAVLVRPDGIVAWRTREGVPAGERGRALGGVLRAVLAR